MLMKADGGTPCSRAVYLCIIECWEQTIGKTPSLPAIFASFARNFWIPFPLIECIFAFLHIVFTSICFLIHFLKIYAKELF